MELADFLLARIAEDEAAARLVLEPYGDRTPHNSASWWRDDREWDTLSSDEAPLVTRYYPQRVLAECEAKRRIIPLADEATGLDLQVDGEFRVGSRNETEEPYCGDLILRALALPYADHPDYQPEWAAEVSHGMA